MSGPGRLPVIAAELGRLGLRFLILGGHAVRHYGVERNTLDYDLHLGLAGFDELAATLAKSPRLAAMIQGEGPSWRPRDFRRFVLGRLPDGQEERLEFWRTNHLLPPFEEAWARRETGSVEGTALTFLGLPDLIRSKETERESDWQDVALLEEIHDARLLTRKTGLPSSSVLAALRSQRGYATARASGWLDEPAIVADAWSLARHPVSAAFLGAGLPAAAEDPRLPAVFGRALAETRPGTARHLALVEAVRRHWKAACVAADRADKERCLAD